MIALLKEIESMNIKIMDFLDAHTEPNQLLEDIKDAKLRSICAEIVKWYSEMGDFWIDDPLRISNNFAWGKKLLAKCDSYKEAA